jgi:hypothetical protein
MQSQSPLLAERVPVTGSEKSLAIYVKVGGSLISTHILISSIFQRSDDVCDSHELACVYKTNACHSRYSQLITLTLSLLTALFFISTTMSDTKALKRTKFQDVFNTIRDEVLEYTRAQNVPQDALQWFHKVCIICLHLSRMC